MAMAVDSRNAPAEERDARVEDYLNDKLQTYDDLGGLESLLSSVKDQHDLLARQVSFEYCCSAFAQPLV
jgi:hypothetical protein